MSYGVIAVKRYHCHDNVYKGKHFIGAGLQFQRFSLLLSCPEAWQHVGMEVEELRALDLDPQKQKNLCYTWHSLNIGDLEPTPTVTSFLQQDHTSTNKGHTS